jgi:hypothetical protein
MIIARQFITGNQDESNQLSPVGTIEKSETFILCRPYGTRVFRALLSQQ